MLTETIQEIKIDNISLGDGKTHHFKLTWQSFGRELNTAPLVLVNHALTGNSEVAGEKGWWNRLIAHGGTIDLNEYTVLAFDIPGNGYLLEDEKIPDYSLLTTSLIAELFWRGLDTLGIKEVYAVIGGSLGGGIAWEMAFLRPDKIRNLIPVAASLQASDWLIGNVLVQDNILNNSPNPVYDARMHAMHLYRTPASFAERFNRKIRAEESQYEIESWLKYHGESLEKRFSLSSYKIMNHLLKTIGEGLEAEDIIAFAKASTMDIYCIAIDSDFLFTREEQWQAFKLIQEHKPNIYFGEIQSIHGHDAFLIEYKQLNHLIKHIF